MKTFKCDLKALALLLLITTIPLNSFAQYYNDVLSYKLNGTPVHGIKIETNIPFVSSRQMPTIILEGYDYGSRTPIDIKLVYYIYQDKFINHKATTAGNYKPDIHLSNENGKVVIFINDQSYYTRFHIRAYADMYEEAAWFEGWKHSDSPMASGLPEGHQVLIPYDYNLPIGVSENGITQIFAPQGGSFVSYEADLTGAIQIKLPVLYTNSMVKFRVEVFNYLTNNNFTATIGGFNYTNSARWLKCSAQILTTSIENTHQVYFGDDGTNAMVWIGEQNTKWQHVKISISEVQVSHGNKDLNTWSKNWAVGIDSEDFSSKINSTVSNTLPLSSGSAMGVSENGITQIYAPEGGSFVKNGTEVKGAIKVKLPVLYSNTMLRFRVEVFNYLTDKSFTATLAGYNHANTANWHNCSAQILTSSLDNAHNVYFGDDGTNAIVWIGEPDSEWKYLKVRISEVQATHANIDISTWNKGWEIDLDTLNFSSKVKRTITNTLPVSSGSSIWQNANNDVFYPNPNGKVGIGTNNLSAELTVNGHIHAKEVKVFTEAGADFVFDENYELTDLIELENFITQNKHLPDIPPEKEMVNEGIQLAEMNVKLLQKVEELTLYVIDMNKQLKTLHQNNLQLKKQIEKKN